MAFWTWLIPALSIVCLVAAKIVGLGVPMIIICAVTLMAAVIIAVHHAEVVAYRLGEPYGTLVLAVAVTAIETALILSMVIAGGDDMAALPRDAIYSAVMIICNGVVGLCLLVGGLAHREQTFRVEGAGAGLAALIAMSTLTLVLPVFTTTTDASTYSNSQLLFVAGTSAALWAIYIWIQTVSHRGYFLPETDLDNESAHAEPPSSFQAALSGGLLLVSLIGVVGLAKVLSPSIEHAVELADAPRAVVGIIIAALVLLPETYAAVRSARANRLQTSMNLSIGSALACTGLTVPVVAVAAIAFNLHLVLGLAPKDLAMLFLTFLVSAITLGTGRTYVMQGAIHLVIFAAFLFLAFVP
jgi:Ca2+:H+ antiporter